MTVFLKINGIETEVETPYVTENNTTLVPLRVITEAFGAKLTGTAILKNNSYIPCRKY